jgi:alcohol dehydrogenase class IV
MILPEYYHFSARTRVVSGLNALQELPKLLRRAGGTNPMIVTDKGTGRTA